MDDNNNNDNNDDDNNNDNNNINIQSLHTVPKRHFYLTRRGKILQSTTENYLRDDLGYGTLLVPDGATSSKSSKSKSNETIAGKIISLVPHTIVDVRSLVNILLLHTTATNNNNDNNISDVNDGNGKKKIRLVIVDTNILLHHMDVLEYLRNDDDDNTNDNNNNKHYAIANAIIIPQTALNEVRHRSLVMYRRATDLVRSSSGSSSDDDDSKKKRRRRCVIVFADVHHVDTQITTNNNNTSSSTEYDGATISSSINDENDARLRKVAYFYGRAIYNHKQHEHDYQDQDQGDDNDDYNDNNSSNNNIEVVFLSDDVQSRKLSLLEQPTKKKSEGGGQRGVGGLYYNTRSMRNHVQILQNEDPTLNLLDMVAQFNSSNSNNNTEGGGGSGTATANAATTATSRLVYTPHITSSKLSSGLQTNMYYQGIYHSNRDSCTEGYATIIRRGGNDNNNNNNNNNDDERVAIVISGSDNINRAVDGDIVAVELYSVDCWLGGSSNSNSNSSKDDDDNGRVKKKKKMKTNEAESGIAADTAEPTVRDMENITEEVMVIMNDDYDNDKNDDGGGQLPTLRRPTGKVVGIIRRNFHKNYCGSICTIDNNTKNDKNEDNKDDDEEEEVHPHDIIAAKHEREHPDGITSTIVFFSIDQRIPPILLRTTQRDRLIGMRILVSIDSWPADSEYPLGHYVKTLGVSGTKDTETQVLLQEFRIPCEPFPAKVLACLPPADYEIKLEPGSGRADLRHIPVLSIDPPGCKDIDDALHCTELPNGNWQVGVHIADVTHYVEAGTAIDLEAANRSTSTYLVNKRLDMLPSLLTTDLCSLKGNVDRFAFSVLWEVTPDAVIVDVEFKKSIIHSIAALTYQQAQSLIDKPDKECKDDIQAGAVKRLASLARKFRARRINAGALTLASPEVKFVLDSESLNPTDVQAYTLYEANALVEEFMLLANVTVAKKILRHYPTLSILRRHPAPNRSMFDSLIQKAKTRGISLCIDDSKKLADSLDEAGKILSDDAYLDQLLRILSTRCMSPAQYFCSGEYQAKDWHHYGLAAPVYTHFTSPIRRYADVCVHRLLAAAIGVAPLPVFLSSKSHLHDLAANMNRRHRAAQLAGRASVQLHTLIFFAGGEDAEEGGGDGGGGAKEEDAYVLDVETSDTTEPSFRVMVPRYGIEGKVRLPNLDKDECLVRDPEKQRLLYKDASTGEILASVAVFDKVRVKIWVKSSRDRKELIVDLLDPMIFSTAGKPKKKKQKTKQ